MKTVKARHAKLLSAMTRIAGGRSDGKPLCADAAMALARTTLISLGERVPAIHIPKRSVYFKVENLDGQAVLRQMDEGKAA